jgi:hypothetical protein
MGVNVILGSHDVCYGSHHNFLSCYSSNGFFFEVKVDVRKGVLKF